MGVGDAADSVAGTPCGAWSHLGLMAVARGWEGMVRRKEGRPERASPSSTRSVPLLRLRASVGGTFMSKCPYQSSDKGRKYFHYSQKGEGEGGGH